MNKPLDYRSAEVRRSTTAGRPWGTTFFVCALSAGILHLFASATLALSLFDNGPPSHKAAVLLAVLSFPIGAFEHDLVAFNPPAMLANAMITGMGFAGAWVLIDRAVRT